MSRCFPFPPPGYEQKATDSVELLTKEKHKSKKDKKEKREKEKKEVKEKKHRDKSKEKHGDKKDRKDKDRDKDKKDKDKKKDKDRNKDRGGASNEKLLEEHTATIGEGRIEARSINDSKIREELQSRIGDDKGAGRNQMVETAFGKVQGRHDGMLLEKTGKVDREMPQSPIDRQKWSEGGGVHIMPGQKIVGNHIFPGSVITGFTGRSIRTEQRNRVGSSGFFAEKETSTEQGSRIGSSSLYPEKDSITEQRKHLGHCSFLPEKNGIAEQRNHITSSGFFPGKDAISEQRNRFGSAFLPERGAISEQKNRLGSSGIFPEKNACAEQSDRSGSFGVFPEKDAISEQRNRLGPSGGFPEKGAISEQRNRLGSSGSFPEKDANKKFDGKEKIGVQGASPQKIEKQKNKEKKSKNKERKERHKDKERKKEKDKTIEKGDQRDKEQKHTSQIIRKEEHRPSIKPVLSSKETEKNASSVGVNLKRKEINGFLHENEVRPVKLQRITTSPHLHIQNGRNLDYNNVSIPHGLEKPVGVTEPCLSVKLEAMDDRKVGVSESKEQKANGAVPHQTTPSTNSKPLVADSGSVINNDDVQKPPHPDTKYLSQILSVPKMAEWPEVDDQEWLFGHGEDMQQKTRTEMESEDTSLVWAKTLKIRADIVALPYVIPY